MRIILFFLLVVFVSSQVVDPRWGVPAYVEPGGWFNVTLNAAISVKSISLTAPGVEIAVRDYKVRDNVISVRVPSDAPTGLYDLVINGGELYEPKSVWVAKISGPLRIVQFTDAHMGVELDMASVYRLIHGVLLANLGPYDVVFFTGDQVDVGGLNWHYSLFVKYASMITKPIFVIPGNHEYAGDDPLENYRRFVGPPVWYRVVGPYLIVGLTSGFNGFLTDDVVDFYERVLTRFPDKVKIVLIHHPPMYIRDRHVVETYRGPQDVDRLARDPTGRSPFYVVYTSYLQNRPAYEKFLDLTIRHRVALVMSGHVHSGNSTVVINGTIFVTTRPLGGAIGTSHGFRSYVVYPDGRVEVGREVWTYKNFAVITYGSKAAQIYVDSELVRGEVSLDLPHGFAGLRAFQGSAELVKVEKHPLGKYDRYTFRLDGKPLWFAVGEYTPSPVVRIERILPRSPAPGDVVTITIRAEDSNVGVPYLVINGSRVLASYIEEQPVYIYRFQYRGPTVVQISTPDGAPQTIQIGQPTTPPPTTPPVTTPPPITTPPPTTPITTPTPTTPPPTILPVTTTPPTTPVVTTKPSAELFPVEVAILVILFVVGIAIALLRLKRF